jgi:hypothetical protein
MKEFTIDLHDGRGNQVYVLKIDQLAALEAVVKERNLEWESIRGQNIRHATVNDELKERIAPLAAERDRLREACGYRWRKLLTETEPKEEEEGK